MTRRRRAIVAGVILCCAGWVFWSSCKSSTAGSELDQQLVHILVGYHRQEPYVSSYNGLDIGEIVAVRWRYGSEVGVQRMTKQAEHRFVAGPFIRTETKVTMFIEDWWKPPSPDGVYYVCKRIFINDQELVFPGSEYGEVEFIYHNDASIEITKPR